MDFDPSVFELALGFIGIVGSGGIAYGVAHGVAATKMQHTREWLSSLQTDYDKHKVEDTVVHLEMVDRLARIETKLDSVLKTRDSHET